MPRGYPGSTLGVDPRSHEVIARRFKQKKFCDEQTNGLTNGRTDRRDGGNSDLDKILRPKVLFSELNSAIALATVRFEFPALSILAFWACFKPSSPSFLVEGTPAYLAHL